MIGSFPTRHDLRFPRTLREAGMEYAEWEGRTPPLRSWGQEIVRYSLIGLGLLAIVFLTTVEGWTT